MSGYFTKDGTDLLTLFTSGQVSLSDPNTFQAVNTFNAGIAGPLPSITYTPDMIGYTLKTYGTIANFNPGSQVVYALISAVIIPGSYIVCMYINSQPSNNAGLVNFLTTGLSTSRTDYVGGIPAISIIGTISIPATVSSRITGSITHPLVVPTTAEYYLLMNCTFSGFTLTVFSSACYFTYTRIG